MTTDTLMKIGRWSAYASGIVTILGLVFLSIFFWKNNRLFGSLNDICIIFQFALILPIALALQASYPQDSTIYLIALILLAIAVILMTITNLMLVAERIAFQQSLTPVMTSFALTGIWLLLASIPRMNNDLPSVLGWLGIVAGIGMGLMALGYIISGYQDPQKSVVGMVGGVGAFLLYPIWAIWLGNVLRGIAR